MKVATLVRAALAASGLALALLPASAIALPQNDRVITYHDETGGTAGIYIRNCLGNSSMLGEVTSSFSVVETRCDAENLDPCMNWPEEFGVCAF